MHTFLCSVYWDTNLLLPFSFWLSTTDFQHAATLLNQVFIHFLCKFIVLLSLIMLCCLFPALTHQLVNIGINCVFISISLCGRGVLGDWHCAWPCEYTMLCINMSASTAIAVVFLKCCKVNSHYCFPEVQMQLSSSHDWFMYFEDAVVMRVSWPGYGCVGADFIM